MNRLLCLPSPCSAWLPLSACAHADSLLDVQVVDLDQGGHWHRIPPCRPRLRSPASPAIAFRCACKT